MCVCSCMFRLDLTGFSISAWRYIRAQQGNQAGQSNNHNLDNENANVIYIFFFYAGNQECWTHDATDVSLKTQK